MPVSEVTGSEPGFRLYLRFRAQIRAAFGSFNIPLHSAGFCLVDVSAGMFEREGFSVTVYKPVEINIIFLQLGLLTGCEPAAVTQSRPQLWGRES